MRGVSAEGLVVLFTLWFHVLKWRRRDMDLAMSALEISRLTGLARPTAIRWSRIWTKTGIFERVVTAKGQCAKYRLSPLFNDWSCLELVRKVLDEEKDDEKIEF